MIVVETCPKCGAPLLDIMLASYPPIPAKRCTNCGYYWQGEPERIAYVPFDPEKSNVNKATFCNML